MAEPVSIVFVVDSIEAPVPSGDDVLLSVLKTLSELKFEATIKLTGERARQIQSRERADLIKGIKSQDIGLYSNHHVGKPTPAEYVGDLGWVDGARKFFITEAPGYDDVCFLGGRIPSCYGNESWLPQSFGALSRWGIRVRICRHSFLSDGDRPYFYGARLNLSQLGPNWIDVGSMICQPEGDLRLLAAIAQRVQSFGGRPGAIVAHLYAEDLWAQRTPDFWKWASEGALRGSLVRSAEETTRGLANLKNILAKLQTTEGVLLQSARQFADRFADISYERRIQLEDLRDIAAHAATGELKPFRYEAGYLAPSEQLYILARAWDETRRKGKLIRNSTLQAPLGPAAHVDTEPSVSGIWAKELPDILANLLAFIHKFARLPDCVETADGVLSVLDLLPTLAGGFHDELEPIDLPLRTGRLAHIDRVNTALAEECWKCPVHSDHFQSLRQLTFARQQLWTYKPVLDISG